MSKKGRPATKMAALRDGFYLEVRNTATSAAIKIRRDTEREMQIAAEEYRKVKVVNVLGEYKNGKPVKK